MITIKMYEGKWRIEVDNEGWEVTNNDDLMHILTELIRMKNTWGRIK